MFDDLKKVVVVIFVISLFLNGYFVKKIYFDHKTVVYQDRIIDRPVEVIRWQTKVVVEKVPVERPSGEAEVLLARLEKATPKVEVERFFISKDAGGTLQVPETVNGSMELDYLKYKLKVKLKADYVYEKPYDLKVAGLVAGYANEGVVLGDVALMWAPIKFAGLETNFGVGLRGAMITESGTVYHNLDFHMGYGFSYRGGSGITTGLSLRL